MSTPTTKLQKHGDTMRGALAWSGTDYAGLTIQSLTTTQRDALSPTNGAMIYNTTTAQFELRQAGAWLAFSPALVDSKDSVEIATTANVTLSGEQTIDGVLTSASRILVKDQSAGAENGIYVTAAGAWARAADFNASAEVTAGATTFVSEGTANGNETWQLTTDDAITLGSTALVFAQIGGGASYFPVTASRALVSDGSGEPAASAVTSTELGYVSGATSNIQDQLDAGASAIPQSEPATNNLFIGTSAGAGLTTGDENTAVGFEAYNAGTSAGLNTAFGFQALKSNTLGNGNTAVGWKAMTDQIDPGGNTAIGTQSMLVSTSSGTNTAVGANTLMAMTSAQGNVAVGFEAMLLSTSAESNIAIGRLTLGELLTGNENVAVGKSAGTSAVAGGNETGANGVFIGFQAAAIADGGTNEIVIGSGATGAGSNSATLGNASVTKTVLRGAVDIAGTVELGHATDTTLSRASAGVVAVEGVALVKADDAGMTNARTPTAHNQAASTITSGTLAAARLPAASTSAVGGLETATAAEVNTGTDAGRAVSPDSLAGSNYGTQVVSILVSDPNGDAITTGDGKAYFRVPSTLAGFNLIAVAAQLTTVSSSGIPTIQIHNVTDAADMLSTELTIDASEIDSSTATTAAVIDTAADDVTTGDQLRFDLDIAGTGAKGWMIELQFRLP